MSQQLELLTENPSQWSAVIYVTPEIQRKEIKPFVVLALKEIEGNPDSRTSSLMNADKFAAVRAVVRHLVRQRSATKEMWAQDDVRSFIEGLRFSPECTSELTALLCTEQIYENIPRHLRVKPGLVGLSWKIDLSLSQSTISAENATPERAKAILLSHTHVIVSLSLGHTTRSCRLTVRQFHSLRFAVASALKGLLVAERRSCMRE